MPPVVDRVAFGRPLAEQGVVQETIADCRIRLEQLRLQVLRCAWLIDTVGAKGRRVRDLGDQDRGTGDRAVGDRQGDRRPRRRGVSPDYPLAMLWGQARGLRFADGPDEVHRMVLARRELRRYR